MSWLVSVHYRIIQSRVCVLCSLYSVTNEVREPNKGTNNTPMTELLTCASLFLSLQFLPLHYNEVKENKGTKRKEEKAKWNEKKVMDEWKEWAKEARFFSFHFAFFPLFIYLSLKKNKGAHSLPFVFLQLKETTISMPGITDN